MEQQKSRTLQLLSLLSIVTFVFFSGWWLINQLGEDASTSHASELFSDTYWVLPLIGGLIGAWVAKKWGGFKSLFGKAISFFAIGLFAQVFGQVVYSYYALRLGVEAPYPSIGDIGYFGSVIFYIIAILLLAKTAGAQFSRVSMLKKVTAIVLPAILLAASYIVFLRDYEVDFASAPVATLLDFGYPLGQAIYVSLALIAFFLSKGLLGGIMKNKILLLLGALVVQYTADYGFLYRFNQETWYPGDFSDYTYLVAYFLMILALLQFGKVAQSVNGMKGEDNG